MSEFNTYIKCKDCKRKLWGKDKADCQRKINAHQTCNGCQGQEHIEFVRKHDKKHS